MINDVWKGQTRGKANLFAKKVENNVIKTCTIKSMIKIKGHSALKQEGDREFKEFITPVK
jgi:hypothetical protein